MEALDALDLRVRISRKPNEVPDADPASSRTRRTASYDPEYAQPLLARAGAGRPRVQAVPRALHRQVQPGAFLLGRARPRGDALLRTAGAAASRRRAEPAGLGGARGLLARGQQLRLLARRRPDAVRRVLLRTRTRSRPASRTRASGRRRVLQHRAARVPPAVRRRPHVAHRPTRRCSSSCSRPTRPPRTWRAGIAPRSSAASWSGPSACYGTGGVAASIERRKRRDLGAVGCVREDVDAARTGARRCSTFRSTSSSERGRAVVQQRTLGGERPRAARAARSRSRPAARRRSRRTSLKAPASNVPTLRSSPTICPLTTWARRRRRRVAHARAVHCGAAVALLAVGGDEQRAAGDDVGVRLRRAARSARGCRTGRTP